MNEDDLVPDDRDEYIRRLVAERDSAHEARMGAQKDLTTTAQPLKGGEVFTQVLTSVLPTILGAAIAGRRGGAVGADVGAGAAQNFFNLGEKERELKRQTAKTTFSELQDLEKNATNKLSTATGDMFRSEDQEKRADERDRHFAAAMANSNNQIAIRHSNDLETLGKRLAGQKDLLDDRHDYEQEKFDIPVAPRKVTAEGKPLPVDRTEFKDSHDTVTGYLAIQPYADNLRSAIKSGDMQRQVESWANMFNQIKAIRGYGAALSQQEYKLGSVVLPPIADMDYEGMKRWATGVARGADSEAVLSRFMSSLEKEVQMRLQKYDFVPPPEYGVMRKTASGKTVRSTGTLGSDGKPQYEAVSGER